MKCLRLPTIALVGWIVVWGLATTAKADVIVFGDSLSDTGNFFVATMGGLPPSPPYAVGRFSNGPLWVEHLAALRGAPAPTPSFLGGTNFAINGARVEGASPPLYGGVPDMLTQVTMYATSGRTPQSGDIFAVWGGANDLFFALSGQVPYVSPDDVVASLGTVITTLAGLGAKEFIVPNLPPLGQTPFFNGSPIEQALDLVTLQFNAALAIELSNLQANLGVHIKQVDVYGLFQLALANPGALGLTNVTDSATLFDPATGLGYQLNTANPNQYLFFDSVHPTATVHGLIGAQAASEVPEPASLTVWALLALTAGGVQCYRRKRRAKISESALAA